MLEVCRSRRVRAYMRRGLGARARGTGSVRVSGAAPAGGSFATAAVTHGRRRSATTTRTCSRRPRPIVGCSTWHACSTTLLTMCPPLRYCAPLASPRAPRPCGSLPHCAAPPFLRAATVFVRGRDSLKCALCPAPATWPPCHLPPASCPCQLAPVARGSRRCAPSKCARAHRSRYNQVCPRAHAHTHAHVRTHTHTHTQINTATLGPCSCASCARVRACVYVRA
jgi:hypothetical protein